MTESETKQGCCVLNAWMNRDGQCYRLRAGENILGEGSNVNVGGALLDSPKGASLGVLLSTMDALLELLFTAQHVSVGSEYVMVGFLQAIETAWEKS